MTQLQQPLGELIDLLHEKRAERKSLEDQAKEVKEEENQLQLAIMQKMEQGQIEKAAGSSASVTLNKSIVPSVKDWDLVYEYIQDNDAFHLLEKRMSAAAFREELELREGDPLPGVEPFTRSTLNIRSR